VRERDVERKAKTMKEKEEEKMETQKIKPIFPHAQAERSQLG